MKSLKTILAVLLMCGCLAQAQTAPVSVELEAMEVEPGITYGTATNLPLPKTIVFSVGPEDIEKDAQAWKDRGVEAFFMDFVAREWSSDIWARDGKAWTIGESDDTFQAAKRANEVCKAIGSETFLKISFDNFFEWFNDAQWDQAYHNFQQFAWFARESGCTGMALDIEYVGDQYNYSWDGYTYDKYTREDLRNKVKERMTRVLSILYDEFPDMIFLTYPEQGFNLGQVIHMAWIEEAARRNAPGGVHYCTEHTYRSPNIRHMLGDAWVCHKVFKQLLSDKAWAYWAEKCTIAQGVWPMGFNYQDTHEPGMTYEQFRQGYAASLMASPRYNWLYSHNCREQLLGRNLEDYTGDVDLEHYLSVIPEREVATNAAYLDVARDLRSARLRDYSRDLDLTAAISFAGPDDVPRVRLVPANAYKPEFIDAYWDLADDYFEGKPINLHKEFGTIKQWKIAGPYSGGDELAGHNTAYEPEQGMNSEDVVDGKIQWQTIYAEDDLAGIDLTKCFDTTENVSAYARCYVTSPVEQEAQIRLGTNDAGKLWLNGELIYDYPYEGTAYLDRDILPVKLPEGKSTLLLKITNGLLNWGFVVRITDDEGKALDNLVYTLD